jgi:hypothetical protein
MKVAWDGTVVSREEKSQSSFSLVTRLWHSLLTRMFVGKKRLGKERLVMTFS